MIYITQLIFVKEGKEEIFHQFEDMALPLMEKYGGQLLYRIRPEAKAFIAGDAENPYEIHFISFDSEQDLAQFMQDETRKECMHLKNASVTSTFLVKGAKM